MPAWNAEASVIGDVVPDVIKGLQSDALLRQRLWLLTMASKDEYRRTSPEKCGATVIDHILNSGAGGATATGLSYAEQNGFDIAATMDSDGQHSVRRRLLMG
jgi:glycosyltransferase involved in cell wall biosynthesis